MKEVLEAYTRREVASIFNVSVQTIRRWEKEKSIIPVFWTGRYPRYSIESVRELVAKKTTIKETETLAQ